MAKKQRTHADDSPEKDANRPLPAAPPRTVILRTPAETQYKDVGR